MEATAKESPFVVPVKTATEELKKWLDYKKISDLKRAGSDANLNRLIVAIATGVLSIDPTTMVVTQKLKFPLGEDNAVTELKYKPRLQISTIHDKLSEFPNDGVGRVLAYICAATVELKAVIEKLDSEDYHTGGDIVVFFMIPG